jgi:hypothetical protein
LSVKIRSNEEIDNYNEEKLVTERTKLQQVSPFMILEYIKTSIEILMNMKMEDAQTKKRPSKADQSDCESVMSGVETPDKEIADYEKMLIKYEASVRNHIKIEQ